jgi:hypothetical protein
MPSEHWLADELPCPIHAKRRCNDMAIIPRLLSLSSFPTLRLAPAAHQQIKLDFVVESDDSSLKKACASHSGTNVEH